MKSRMLDLTAEYAEYEEDSGKLTFTPENWDLYIGKVAEVYAEILDTGGKDITFMGESVEYWTELKAFAEEGMTDELIKAKLLAEAELAEFTYSGWEANGNKLYLKGEEQY